MMTSVLGHTIGRVESEPHKVSPAGAEPHFEFNIRLEPGSTTNPNAKGQRVGVRYYGKTILPPTLKINSVVYVSGFIRCTTKENSGRIYPELYISSNLVSEINGSSNP